MKNYLIVLGTAFLLFIILAACVFNPYDKQYQSYYDETAAMTAYSNNDINSFFKLTDTPTTVKHHTGRMLILSVLYKMTGRYEDSIRVLNSFERERDYSFCALDKEPVKKIACRLAFTFYNDSYHFDRNEKISNVYYEKGDYKKAKEYSEKADKINHCYKARIYANMNESDKAESSFEQCKIKNKKEITKTKGIIFHSEKKYAQAEKEYLSLINKACSKSGKCKGNNDVYMLLGKLYYDQGQFAKAISYYKKVLKQEPYTYKANYYAAQCSLKMNKKSEALKYLENILVYSPDNKAEIESEIKAINSKIKDN